MIKKICASFGIKGGYTIPENPRDAAAIVDYTDMSDYGSPDFVNAIHCKHCHVEDLGEKMYEISCKKRFTKMPSGIVTPRDGLRCTHVPHFLDGIQITEKGEVKEGLKTNMPSIGEYRAPLNCWDFEARISDDPLIDSVEGVVHLGFRFSNGLIYWYEVDSKGNHPEKACNCLEGRFPHYGHTRQDVNSPVIKYSVANEAVQYERDIEFYPDGRIRGHRRITMHPDSEASIDTEINNSVIAWLVNITGKAMGGLEEEKYIGEDGLDFHKRVLIELNKRRVVYGDKAPSKDIENLECLLDHIFSTLPWNTSR